MKRYLFLDIDGVLNGHEWNETSESNTIDYKNVLNLNLVIEKTKCKIILHSAWRYMIHGKDMTIRGFEYLLRTHGVTSNLYIDGITESDKKISKREVQIEEYLRYLREEFWFKEDFKYAIVDDLPLFFTESEIQDNFVRTDGKFGMSLFDAEKLIEILGCKI